MRKIFYPQNELLKKHVRYITYFKEPDASKTKSYYVFPNLGSAIVLGKNLSFEKTAEQTYQSHQRDGFYSNILHLTNKRPVRIIEIGKQEKISIVFYPLGINYFLSASPCTLVKNNDPSWIDIEQLETFQNLSEKVYQQKGLHLQINYIESFLLKLYRSNYIPYIEEAVTLLMDIDRDYSIREVAKKVGTTARNLSRLFKKFVCISPEDFKNIHKFRATIKSVVENDRAMNFKDMSYAFNYSDLSYMIRIYQKYTGISPSRFFSKMSTEAEGNYVFVVV